MNRVVVESTNVLIKKHVQLFLYGLLFLTKKHSLVFWIEILGKRRVEIAFVLIVNCFEKFSLELCVLYVA